jgi:cholesterol oxidase
MSGRVFTTDTVDTTLAEYLHEAGHDVLVLDHRPSIDLAASEGNVTADQVADYDWPAAVATVREVTGAPSIDVVAQGFGALTLQMALIDGLQGVRSAVLLQMGLHLVTPALARLKSGLHLPGVLKAMGKQTLTARTETRGWQSRVFDAALRVVPTEESCASRVCRRIIFMYGPLYEHEQLNRATHDALHELFGVTSLSAFDQMARMVRQGHAVRTDGATYLRNLDRLALPMTFIHGANNRCFLPESTKLTYDALVSANGRDYYRREVVADYGDVDCLIGKNAVQDVVPHILTHLRAQSSSTSALAQPRQSPAM